jgi:hypothetical protein
VAQGNVVVVQYQEEEKNEKRRKIRYQTSKWYLY